VPAHEVVGGAVLLAFVPILVVTLWLRRRARRRRPPG